MTNGVLEIITVAMQLSKDLDKTQAIAHAYHSATKELSKKVASFCESRNAGIVSISAPMSTLTDDMVIMSVSGVFAIGQTKVKPSPIKPLDNLVNNVDKLGGSIDIRGNQYAGKQVIEELIRSEGLTPEQAEDLNRQINELAAGVSRGGKVQDEETRSKQTRDAIFSAVQSGGFPNMSGIFE